MPPRFSNLSTCAEAAARSSRVIGPLRLTPQFGSGTRFYFSARCRKKEVAGRHQSSGSTCCVRCFPVLTTVFKTVHPASERTTTWMRRSHPGRL
jgi:hypothetical protein